MDLVKVSELRKIFCKWSHGTLYNRLNTLGIKDNTEYGIKNAAEIFLYNEKAIFLLKDQYLKEFSNDLENDKKEIDKVIKEILSNKESRRGTEKIRQKENVNNDNIDNFDNKEKVNFINSSLDNEKYILRELHNEIVNTLKQQIDSLQQQLDRATDTNANLVETIRLREEKDIVVEKQNLFKLQQKTLIAAGDEQDQEQDSQKKKKGFFFFGSRRSGSR